MKLYRVLPLVVCFVFSINVLAQSPPSVGRDHPTAHSLWNPSRLSIIFILLAPQSRQRLI